MMNENNIIYVIGDATQPQGEGRKIIPHICNDIGAWGAGFVLALSRRWKEPEQRYRRLDKYVLGTVELIQVEKDICVANIIGQHGIGVGRDGKSPIRYDALEEALRSINEIATSMNATIHMPKIGSGLAGGDWDVIENIINKTLTIDVTVYTLK